MVGRRSVRALATLYDKVFSGYVTMSGHWADIMGPSYRLYTDRLYDFLYESGYDSWFLNLVKALPVADKRSLTEFIMRLHTGESLLQVTPNWTQEQRIQLGQQLLRRLATDALTWTAAASSTEANEAKIETARLVAELELDGYLFRDGVLQFSEADVLDPQEETGILHALIRELGLANQNVMLHHLSNSESLYSDGRWGECITNARSFLESVLREVASRYSTHLEEDPMPEDIYDKPFKVREWLQSHGLIESKEKEALSKVYGVLSHEGGHPYIAERDQARLMRHLALTFAQFVLLKLRGALASAQGNPST